MSPTNDQTVSALSQNQKNYSTSSRVKSANRKGDPANDFTTQSIVGESINLFHSGGKNLRLNNGTAVTGSSMNILHKDSTPICSG